MTDEQGEESDGRKRVRRTCANRDHARLLIWHDMWARTVHEADATREQQREAIQALNHKVMSLEAELRYMRLLGTERGATATREHYEGLLDQAQTRERGWRDEFEYARRRAGEETDRALRAEELIEQGLLRELQLIRNLERYYVASFDYDIEHDTMTCRICTATMAGAAGRSNDDDMEHSPTCPVPITYADAQYWRAEGGHLRELKESELGRLRRSLVMTGQIERLAVCPSCGADRTNGEWHDDGCSLVPIMEQLERSRGQ